MGVVFQLGHNDHKVVEDFLLRRPAGVSGITLHAKAARHQQAAAEAAQAASLSVFFNPATERLTAPGYVVQEAPYSAGAPYDVDALAGDAPARARLIEGVISGHPTGVSAVTPAHFYVNNQRAASLNVVLASDTANCTDLPVRAVLVLDRRFGSRIATELAWQYVEAGVTNLELRLTPFGGEDASLAKIKSGLSILDAFRNAGITTTLGCSGNVGHAAVALGHAQSYSVGIGVLEHVNHAAAMTQQGKPPKLDENGKKKSGPSFEGVYLPGIAATISRKAADVLLGHTDIRLRLGCRLEECGTSVAGPTKDSRRHYLHARAHEMHNVTRKPTAWRATTEADRLSRALALRELVNDKYRPRDTPALKTRTLRSLLDLSGGSSAAQTA